MGIDVALELALELSLPYAHGYWPRIQSVDRRLKQHARRAHTSNFAGSPAGRRFHGVSRRIETECLAARLGVGLDTLESRMHHNKVVIPLANKLARVAWVVLTRPGALYEEMDPRF